MTRPLNSAPTTVNIDDLIIYRDPRPLSVADMSQLSHESPHAKISCDPTASSPTPVHEGQSRGYFNDKATRALLGLEAEVIPLHSGTYGEAEPGVKPVKLSLLRQKLYDRLFLPFVPQKHWFHHTPISMYEKNQQYTLHFDARRELDGLFSKALIDAQLGAKETGLNLPHYALTLVPKLRYKVGGDERPFFYHLLIFFSPSAHRMRAARIGRVSAILDAMTNLVQALQGDPGEWEKGSPVGMIVDVEELTEEDRALISAYRSLSMPVEGALPSDMPPTVTTEQARVILFGKSKSKATELPDETDLPDGDDDALFYATIQDRKSVV